MPDDRTYPLGVPSPMDDADAVEFIGMIAPQQYSEIIPPTGPVVDPPFTIAFAQAHEDAGFDRVLIGYFSSAPDGFIVASWVLQATARLGVLLAHRPGFVAPTVAARKLATLDQFSGGRLALHVITGGSDADQAKDGDFLDKASRYRRTDEYLDVLRRTWTATEPFDVDGEFYRVRRAYSAVRCVRQPHLPIYFGGSSDEAVTVSAKHADVYALWGEPLAEAAAHIKEVKAAAAAYGREPRISLSTRPILAATDAEAWDRAYAILDQIQAQGPRPGRGPAPENVGSQRLLAAAAKGDVLDRCLFTPLATASGARGNSTALVGSVDTVADALLDYYDIGVTTFLIRGYDPYDDAIGYGDLITAVRDRLARYRRPRSAGS
jgi:alkanesulfonate monooxygenase